MRAGLVTSLGFGHVGAIALVLHPAAFVAQLTPEQRQAYQDSALAHLEKARQNWARIWMGQQIAFQKRTERRFDFADGTACQEAQEASMLLNPEARLDPETGRFVVPEAP
jgi:fatty acid synthase